MRGLVPLSLQGPGIGIGKEVLEKVFGSRSWNKVVILTVQALLLVPLQHVSRSHDDDCATAADCLDECLRRLPF